MAAIEAFSSPGNDAPGPGGDSASASWTAEVQLLHQAMQHILSRPPVLALCGSLGAANEHPDLAESVCKLASAYSRHLLPGCGSEALLSEVVGSVARVSAAVTCSHSRSVATLGMATMGDLVGAACTSSSGIGGMAGGNSVIVISSLARAVLANCKTLCAGVVGEVGLSMPYTCTPSGSHHSLMLPEGGFLSSFPLSRLNKAASVLTDLIALFVASLCAEGDGSPSNRGAIVAAVASCFDLAKETFQMSQGNSFPLAALTCCNLVTLNSGQTRALTDLWPDVMVDVALGLRASSSRERAVQSRRLIKVIRDFAEGFGCHGT